MEVQGPNSPLAVRRAMRLRGAFWQWLQPVRIGTSASSSPAEPGHLEGDAGRHMTAAWPQPRASRGQCRYAEGPRGARAPGDGQRDRSAGPACSPS